MIHLRNDHKEVMQYLEKGVHAHFANLQNTPDASPITNGTSHPPAAQALPDRSADSSTASGTPFAKVNSVVTGSPADQAGLKAGDAIRNFGGVNWLNHERLTKVAETVQQNEGVCHHSASLSFHSNVRMSNILSFKTAGSISEGQPEGRYWCSHRARSPAHSSAKLGRTWLARMPLGSVVEVLN